MLSGEGVPLRLSGLREFSDKKELLELMKELGVRDIAVDVPLYLPGETGGWRDEERVLRELRIGFYSPRARSMLALHSWAKELFEIEGEIQENGSIAGFGGKCRVFEVYPNASFTILARSLKMAPLAPKGTIRGLFQRVEILSSFVRGPEDWCELTSLTCGADDALDAVAAALTHFFIEKGNARRLGKCLWVPATSPPEGSSSP